MRSGISSPSQQNARLLVLLMMLGCVLVAASCAATGQQDRVAEGGRRLQRGRELRQAGDLQGARREFERATEILPDSDNAFYMLAITYDDLGETEKAARAFQKSIALNPNRAVAHSGYGEVLRKLNDKQGALREHSEALRLNDGQGNIAPFLIALGDAQELNGDVTGARLSFEKATTVEAEPKVKAVAFLRLGYLLADAGEVDKAVESLRRGLDLDPTDAYARQRLAELEAKSRSSK